MVLRCFSHMFEASRGNLWFAKRLVAFLALQRQLPGEARPHVLFLEISIGTEAADGYL